MASLFDTVIDPLDQDAILALLVEDAEEVSNTQRQRHQQEPWAAAALETVVHQQVPLLDNVVHQSLANTALTDNDDQRLDESGQSTTPIGISSGLRYSPASIWRNTVGELVEMGRIALGIGLRPLDAPQQSAGVQLVRTEIEQPRIRHNVPVVPLRSLICTACDREFESREFNPSVDIRNSWPCGHIYCSECSAQMWRVAISDRGYTLQCCNQPLSIALVENLGYFLFATCRLILEHELEAVVGRAEEHNDRNPLYCHITSCGAYIRRKRRYIGHQAYGYCFGLHGSTRGRSAVRTCIRCRKGYHLEPCLGGGDIDDKDTDLEDEMEDLEDREVLRLAHEKKWKRCKKYANVELSSAMSVAKVMSMDIVVGIKVMGIEF
ncbi:hypothetical protein BJ508DRAFT_304916 [Ascobolus immersus RN42]|uniref:RING-type domain-containing protein n=1 Tax=Ascobolus immersus RN42 TaxID=1160509 RepID=A0A3N4ICK3_ASCIM|nr:hypothetical protein BJ508DRAFT_304916 [Ascobolus immersus RN42]